MISVKLAIRNALSFMDDVYGQENVQDPRLEEVELSEDGTYWCVTISVRGYPSSSFEAIGGVKDRNFKVIRVRAGDGTIESMKIGTLS